MAENKKKLIDLLGAALEALRFQMMIYRSKRDRKAR